MMTTEPDAPFLSSLAATDEPAYARLRARLADQAQQAGILDVAYRTIGTPVGELLLAATERGEQVGEPVVVAHLAVLVMGERLASLGGQIAHPPCRLLVTTQDHPPATGGHDLVPIEGQRAWTPLRASSMSTSPGPGARSG